MNGGDQAMSFLYLIGLLVLVLSALAMRRIPIAQSLKMTLGWLLIFLVVVLAFILRDDFRDLGRRLLAEGSGEAMTVQQGEVLRIRQSPDGHYWVTARLNGEETRFLVDSGATVTTISKDTARRAGIEPSGMPVLVQTANGPAMVRRGRASTVELGSIERPSLKVHISDGMDGTNVLGMNFLSSLSGWGVEDRWLVLRP